MDLVIQNFQEERMFMAFATLSELLKQKKYPETIKDLKIAIEILRKRMQYGSDVYADMAKKLIALEPTTENICELLFHYTETFKINEIQQILAQYPNLREEKHAKLDLWRLQNSIKTFNFDKYYLDSFNVIMNYLRAGYRSYDIMNLHHLTLPWTETQYNEYYKLDSNMEYGRMPSKIFQFAKTDKEKLTVGFYSNDFYNRPSGQLAYSLFKYLKDMVNLIIICHNPNVQDDYMKFFQKNCHKFILIGAKNSFMDTAKIIYDEKIDVLIDMKGKMIINELEIFRMKPSPVQISWLAYPGSTGLDEMDYLIGDEIVFTPEMKETAPEKMISFPYTYQVNNDDQKMEPYAIPPEDLALFKNTDRIVLANLNFIYKMDPDTIEVMKRVLTHRPNTCLVFLSGNNNQQIFKHFQEFKDRIYFQKYLPKNQHFYRMYQLVDICIDSINCNSHTTASDFLYAGVPIVTLKGKNYQSRVCASLLQNIGRNDLVTLTKNNMVEKILELIDMGKSELQTLKEDIRYRVFTSNIFNTYNYAEVFAYSCRQAYDNWFNDKKNHINVPLLELYTEKKLKTYTKMTLELPIKNLNIIKIVMGTNVIVLVRNEKLMYLNTVKINLQKVEDKVKLLFIRKDDNFYLSVGGMIKMDNGSFETMYLNKPLHFGYHPEMFACKLVLE